MSAELKECPHCGSPAELEDHRLIWCVVCTSAACTAQVLGDRAPEPDGEMGDAYWDGYKQTAIDRWNARAISPPVAAGSVDTPTWTSEAISCAYLPGTKEFVELEIHRQIVADALAVQLALFKKAGDSDQAEFNRKWTEQKDRAEKAEAELSATKQALAYEQSHAAESEVALAAEHAALLKAEARVKELETALSLGGE